MTSKSGLILFLSFLFFFTTHAQSDTDIFSEIRKKKNHLELDIKNIFSGLGNSSIIYKRKYKSGQLIDVTSIKLLRIFGRLNTQVTFTDDPTRSAEDTTMVGFHPSDVLDISFGLGFEKQKMNGNFVHYYGLDAIAGYYSNDDDFYNSTVGGVINNSTFSTDRLLSNIRGGLNPFFGIKYYLTNSISVSIETGVSITYFRQSISEIVLDQVFVDGVFRNEIVIRDPVISNGIATKFNNLRFLTLGYAF